MTETELQKLFADAIAAGGGQAMKMNNEFVKGPSDLLVKLQHRPAFFLEAKRTDLGPRTVGLAHHQIQWDVTQLQKNFMRDWTNAGMWCGVLSFVQVKGQDVRSLRMAIYSYDSCVEQDWTGVMGDHIELGDKSTRNVNIQKYTQTYAGF